MIGIREEADPAGEVYDPAGIDMIEEDGRDGNINDVTTMKYYSSKRG